MSCVCRGPRTVLFMLIVLGRRKAETQCWDTGADQEDRRVDRVSPKIQSFYWEVGHGVASQAEGKGGSGRGEAAPHRLLA